MVYLSGRLIRHLKKGHEETKKMQGNNIKTRFFHSNDPSIVGTRKILTIEYIKTEVVDICYLNIEASLSTSFNKHHIKVARFGLSFFYRNLPGKKHEFLSKSLVAQN